MKIPAIVSLALSLCAQSAHSEVVHLPERAAVLITGEVGDADVDRVVELAETQDIATLIIDTYAADWDTHMMLADVVAGYGLGTEVGAGSHCADACLLTFLAGSERAVLGTVSTGFGRLGESHARLLDVLESWGERREIILDLMNPVKDGIMTQADVEYLGLNRSLEQAEEARIAGQERGAVAFSDYRVDLPAKVYNAQELTGLDATAATYRTRLQHELQQGPNFAGILRVVEIGCGTGCRFLYLIDVASGQVAEAPYGGEEQLGLIALYAPDSQLLRLSWVEGEGACRTNDLVFADGSVELIADWTGHEHRHCW